jgi:signal transduction histidine kinase
VAAFYVVAEALTNAAKYARASVVHVAVEAPERILRIAVRDGGVGGADPARGSGLLGLKGRAEAIGGTISLQSPRASAHRCTSRTASTGRTGRAGGRFVGRSTG